MREDRILWDKRRANALSVIRMHHCKEMAADCAWIGLETCISFWQKCRTQAWSTNFSDMLMRKFINWTYLDKELVQWLKEKMSAGFMIILDIAYIYICLCVGVFRNIKLQMTVVYFFVLLNNTNGQGFVVAGQACNVET